MSKIISKLFPKYGTIDEHIPELFLEPISVAPSAKDIIPDYIAELTQKLDRVVSELKTTNESIDELTLKKKSLNIIKMTLEASLSTAAATQDYEEYNIV